MYHTHHSKHSPSNTSSVPSHLSSSSWGTIGTDRGSTAHGASHIRSSGYTPSSSSSAGRPYTFTYTPQESERALSPRPLPLSPPQSYTGWSSSSSSSSFSPSTGYGDGVWHSHGAGGAGSTRPVLNPLLVWGNCSVSFDIGAPPPFLHHSIATQAAFPVYDGPIRILFRDHPTWVIEISSRTPNGERVSVGGFLKHLYGFIHAEVARDQYSVAAKTEDSHEAGRLPRMASPQPSFSMSSNHATRVVDRRTTSTAGGDSRGLRRCDFMGTKRVFVGLMSPQHPQDGSAWYVVFADANGMNQMPTHPYTRS